MIAHRRNGPRAEATLEELEAALRIDEHRMEEMCRNQPMLFYEAAKRLALAISKRDQLHQRAKETEAEIYLQLRSDAETELRARVAREEIRPQDAKITEKTLEHLVADADRMRDIKQQELDADYTTSQWWALKDAFTDRRAALDQLIKLYLANYYGSDMDRPQRDLRDVNTAIARRAQSEVRAQRRHRD